LNSEKGLWYDHRDSVGGGLLSLVQHVRGCDRPAALRWLADFNGIPLIDRPLTTAERREFARHHSELLEVARWKKRLVEALKRIRERWFGI
jgi:hypothetical protein